MVRSLRGGTIAESISRQQIKWDEGFLAKAIRSDVKKNVQKLNLWCDEYEKKDKNPDNRC